MRIRTITSGLLSVALLSAGTVVATATPAAAATPKCTQAVKMKPRANSSYFMLVPKSSTTVACSMSHGTSGSAVRALQTALAYCYNVVKDRSGNKFRPGDIDGVYGSATSWAVEHVQLLLWPTDPEMQDGIYGPATAINLKFPWHNPANDSIMSTCTRRDGS
ncbi:peptidoglycan-binding domain-containing protein [Streptomyces sp. NPDC006296]|uniref:peptidoglycan-binding domain-containing protein n=1 Tax=Streptomyces sp. NPDC006296 TaxID=3156746 RepID=UPI0033A3BD23